MISGRVCLFIRPLICVSMFCLPYKRCTGTAALRAPPQSKQIKIINKHDQHPPSSGRKIHRLSRCPSTGFPHCSTTHMNPALYSLLLPHKLNSPKISKKGLIYTISKWANKWNKIIIDNYTIIDIGCDVMVWFVMPRLKALRWEDRCWKSQSIL